MARYAFAIAIVLAGAACGPPAAHRATRNAPARRVPLEVSAPSRAELVCILDGDVRRFCVAELSVTVTSSYARPVFIERLRRDDVTGALSIASPEPVLLAPGVLVLPVWSHRAHSLAV